MDDMVVCPHCGRGFSLMLECKRCGHKWRPRQDEPPTVCPNPKCKSPYWDKPRTKKTSASKAKK